MEVFTKQTLQERYNIRVLGTTPTNIEQKLKIPFRISLVNVNKSAERSE